MSGHSKWNNIKRRKAAADGKREKIFAKILREITVAAKTGADPSTNSKLADAIAKGRSNNLPNENINRILKKAMDNSTENYESIIYEGYGVGGVAVIIETLTDNKVRTVGNVRHALDKYGGGLGSTGSVAFMFDTIGIIAIEKADGYALKINNSKVGEDDFAMLVLENNASDLISHEDAFEVRVEPGAFSALRACLEKEGFKILNADIERVPKNYVLLNDEQMIKFEKMIDMLDDDDDVQEIYHNLQEE